MEGKGGRGIFSFKYIISLTFFVVIGIIFVSNAYGGLILEGKILTIYEDNFFYRAEEEPQLSNIYTVSTLRLGSYIDIYQMRWSVKGEYKHYFDYPVDYNSNNFILESDMSIGTLSVGVSKEISNWNSVSIEGKFGVEDYEKEDIAGDNMDSAFRGVVIEFKQQIRERYWITESYEYEDNTGNDDFYSYTAHSFCIWSWMNISNITFLSIGYEYWGEKGKTYTYKNNTFSVNIEREVFPYIYIELGYDYQTGKTKNIWGSQWEHKNNIYYGGVDVTF